MISVGFVKGCSFICSPPSVWRLYDLPLSRLPSSFNLPPPPPPPQRPFSHARSSLQATSTISSSTADRPYRLRRPADVLPLLCPALPEMLPARGALAASHRWIPGGSYHPIFVQKMGFNNRHAAPVRQPTHQRCQPTFLG